MSNLGTRVTRLERTTAGGLHSLGIIEAGERLPELKKQLGDAILRTALGDAKDVDISAARFAVLNAERAIEAGNLILEPARRAQAKITGESLKWQRRMGYRRDFGNLKAKVTADGHAKHSDVMLLRDLSLTLTGSHDEAETFLANLAKAAQGAA